MKIRNKRTGKVVCLDAVGEMVAVSTIVIVGVLAFKPVLGLALDLFLAITGGR